MRVFVFEVLDHLAYIDIAELLWVDGGSPGKRAFAREVFTEFERQFGAPMQSTAAATQGAASGPDAARNGTTALTEALLAGLMAKQKPIEKVNLSERMDHKGLSKLFPVEVLNHFRVF